jgi:ankyrin repeat protein
MLRLAGGSVVLVALVACPANAGDLKDDLWAAAKKGDARRVETLLAKGVDVNAKTRYGATALSFAADKGHVEVVKVLLRHKADVNVKDTFYKATPVTWALLNGHPAIVKLLIEAGAKDLDSVLISSVALGNADVVRALLDKGKFKPETLNSALAATPTKSATIRELLTKAGAKITTKPAVAVAADALKSYAGTYRNDEQVEVTIALEKGKLAIKNGSQQLFALEAVDKMTFRPVGIDGATVVFQSEKGKVSAFVVKTKSATSRYARFEQRPRPALNPAKLLDDKPGKVAAPQNWPSFRGPHASGVADGQMPPPVWDAAKGLNIRWKTAIPGLGHSCPVVWGDLVFVTTAVGEPKASVKTGLYGDVHSVKDATKHRWQVLCLDKRTGKVLWERTAHDGVPKVKRHPKSTHANPTPATDGRHVVACFGSEGLYCYDCKGDLLWKQQLGLLDSGWFYDPDYQWGFGSSPIIYRDLVFVQCDAGKNCFIAAYHLKDGTRAWLTPRDEVSSWGTPTIWENKARVELVANGTRFVRGYDPLTGKELWRLGGNSEITVPTPIFGKELLFITSGYRAPKPVYAIKPGATGDITPKDGKTSGEYLAWSNKRGGTYMPTPIVYGDYVYTCSNAGIVTCYRAATGQRVYQERLGGTNGYTASPVAADGKLYFTGENGRTQVVKAGPKFEVLAVNGLGDACLATPAISDGMMFMRTEHFLFGIGRPPAGNAR